MTCDYCDEGLPLDNGWHLRTDEEGDAGTERIPCQKDSAVAERRDYLLARDPILSRAIGLRRPTRDRDQ